MLCHTRFASADQAAVALCAMGVRRVLITDGGGITAEGSTAGISTRQPPAVQVARVTGAGDTFMAAHIAAEQAGAAPDAALDQALAAAAAYISGETP